MSWGVRGEGLCHPVTSHRWRCGCAVQSSVLIPHFSPSRKQVLGTKVDAERDGVKVPTTLAEYCVKTKTPAPDEGSDLFYDDYYEDDEMEEEADSCYGDEDDSGNEES